MSHNITEYAAPRSEYSFTHLTVSRDVRRDNKREATFQFGSGKHFSVTIGDHYVPVVGEDLYAFRELLNELPEEAFVRPADPVAESWSFKDINGEWWIWDARVEDGGAWRGVWAIHAVPYGNYGFRDLENGPPYRAFVEPEPESYYYVDGRGKGYVYLADWDGWRLLTNFIDDQYTKPRHNPGYAGFNDGLAALIMQRGVLARETPEPTPRWFNGDRVLTTTPAGSVLLYTRHGRDNWSREVLKGNPSLDYRVNQITDEIMSTSSIPNNVDTVIRSS